MQSQALSLRHSCELYAVDSIGACLLRDGRSQTVGGSIVVHRFAVEAIWSTPASCWDYDGTGIVKPRNPEGLDQRTCDDAANGPQVAWPADGTQDSAAGPSDSNRDPASIMNA